MLFVNFNPICPNAVISDRMGFESLEKIDFFLNCLPKRCGIQQNIQFLRNVSSYYKIFIGLYSNNLTDNVTLVRISWHM